MKYQNKDVKTYGCGPVALYNAFLFTGKRHFMSMVIKEVEDGYQPCTLGGAPDEVVKQVLKDHNLFGSSTKSYNKVMRKTMHTRDSFILQYYTKSGGSHYVFGVFVASEYRIWNVAEKDKKYRRYDKIDKIENFRKIQNMFYIDEYAGFK